MSRRQHAEAQHDLAALEVLGALCAALGITLTGWQRTHIVDPYFARRGDGSPRFKLLFVELAKGLGKTTLAALLLLAKAAVTPGLMASLVAVDSEQAAILLKMMAAAIGKTPMLRRRIKALVGRLVFDNGAEVSVLASDVPSAHGLGGVGAAFAVVADEMHAWAEPDLWHTLWASSGKLRDTQFLVITNAGMRTGVYWQVRTLAASGAGRAYFYAPGGEAVAAEWQTAEERAEFRETMRRSLPGVLFDRYILSQPGEGPDCFLTREQVMGCVDPGYDPQLASRLPTFVACDLGLTKDRAAIGACAWNGDRLDVLNVWTADPQEIAGGEVLIAAAEVMLCWIAEAFPVQKILCDPWQMAASRQKLQATLPIQDFPYVTSNQEKVSATLYGLIAGRRLRLYDDEALIDELVGLQTVVTPKGFRFDHRRGGHNDRAVAVGMACFAAVERGYALGAPLLLTGGRRLSAGLQTAGLPHDRQDAWLNAGQGDRGSIFDTMQEGPGGAYHGGRSWGR